MSQEILIATENVKKVFIDQYYHFLQIYTFGRGYQFSEMKAMELKELMDEHPVSNNRDLAPFWMLKTGSASQKAVLLVDVRDPQERSISQLPNSMNTAEMFKVVAKIAENLRHAEKTPEIKQEVMIICYDTVGKRSGEYLNFLTNSPVFKNEYKDVIDLKFVNLIGGIAEWTWTEGTKLVRKENDACIEADSVDVKSKLWNLANENKYKIICEENQDD